MGKNQFFWADKPDILHTLNSDIIMVTSPPIPVSSRYNGLNKDNLAEVEKRSRVSVVVVFKNIFIQTFESFSFKFT